MDILNNVSKQKNETKKVIEEIRTVQKDINMQEGKLSRTYADTDHLLFEVNIRKIDNWNFGTAILQNFEILFNFVSFGSKLSKLSSSKNAIGKVR